MEEEIVYIDKDGNIIPTKEGAVKAVIYEYDKDGNVEQVTTLYKKGEKIL